MSKRIFNFSAGPATLPLEALEEAQKELLNYKDLGMSVMEMSHRSAPFEAVLESAKASLTRLLSIPDTHEVLFVQGGASLQFSMVPMNFLAGSSEAADVIETGVWVQKAIKEMEKIGPVRVVASSKDAEYKDIPSLSRSDFNPKAPYAYICSNNTIYGTQYHEIPDVGGLPLVADMSSDILSKPLDISKFSLIFAGAQKNLGPAGVTVLILRKSWLEKAAQTPASMLSYASYSKSNSMYNTPPTLAIYFLSLCLKQLEKRGTLSDIEKINHEKATLLYDFIDESKFYFCPVKERARSLMNPVFLMNKGGVDLEKAFVAAAKKEGLDGLKGHRLVGGLRASIYNAFPKEGIHALIDFMKRFEKENT